jgi:hypothetical protein
LNSFLSIIISNLKLFNFVRSSSSLVGSSNTRGRTLVPGLQDLLL